MPAAAEWTRLERGLAIDVAASVAAYTEALEAIEFRKAARALEGLWSTANRYWSAAEPWRADAERAGTVVAVGLNLLRVIGVLGAPWIPETSGRLLSALGVAADGGGWVEGAELDALPAGQPVRAIEPLFEKVTDEEVAAWRARFAGVPG
ncbi:MAG TPA: hypothetical protein VOB72_25085 [Candidatus Dormibacteraeota bacterium]|nr:hypothetical protein [Candidatus Dormibacteraeota bacterium]